jgi:IS30 family transposase
MPAPYIRLTDDEREEISRGLASGESFGCIARRLKRPTSAVSRAVNANGGRNGFRAQPASRRAKKNAASRRAGKRKLDAQDMLRAYVITRIKKRWSPDQIARMLQRAYPDNEAMRIAPETIYEYVYVLPRGELKQSLIKGLRQERKHRRKHKTAAQKEQETRGKIADMLSIEERPKEVAERIIPGHWEGDLIMGKYKRSAIGTLVERTTRYLIIVPLKAKDAVTVRKTYAKEIQTLPEELRKSLTYDQGKEMSEHVQFTFSTGMRVYFAHPGSPWERGTNENTNGLLRQYFPKGTDFRTVSVKDIKRVQRSLNGRPRKSLGYYTPQEKLNELVALKAGD